MYNLHSREMPDKGQRCKMERKCIVKGQTADRTKLLRFVLDPSGIVVADIKEKLPGRGVWVTCNKSCLEEAVKKKLFARAFKTKCKVPDDLPQTIDTMLETRALSSLSLAKKAGQVVSGFDKVFLAMSKTRLSLLIEAKDGAEGGQNKLEKKFSAIFPEGKVIKLFTSAQMDMAFGNTNVIHAAITTGNMTQNVLAAIEKLANYRGF